MKLLPNVIKKRIKEFFYPTDPKQSFENKTVTKPILPLTSQEINFLTTKTQVSIKKARQVLNYQPKYSFTQGMKHTYLWAQSANLLN